METFTIILVICAVAMLVIAIILLFSQSKIKTENEKMNMQLESNVRSLIESGFRGIIKDNQDSTDKLTDRIAKSLNEIRETNEKKLQDIQNNVNEKLDKSLNERLDSSFKTIGEQLQNLHKNLGELQNLSIGVDSLQKTLSNVKTRGVYGEAQLENILANVLDPSQYEVQFNLKGSGKEAIDFAVKIPQKDEKENFIYLPIDSKFPIDRYNALLDAYNTSDDATIKSAVQDLKQAIEIQARSIRDKYLDPPKTTAFAIMFLPTESLYAEVLRIDGLAEKCQNEYKVVIQGPTTITALINSFSIGFRYLSVNKKAKEIEKTLQAIKSQYDTFTDLINKTKDKIKAAMTATESLSSRNEQISKKLSKFEKIDINESNNILELDTLNKDEE